MDRASASRQILLGILSMLTVLYVGLVALRILWPLESQDAVLREAADNALAPDLIGAIIYAESRFDPDAVSPRGALGLMQIMPETGAWISRQLDVSPPTETDLHNVDLNVRFGAWYLRYLLDRFGDLRTALAAYNAGPSNVERWQASAAEVYPETAAFVRRVLSARPIYRFYFRFPGLMQITPSLTF